MHGTLCKKALGTFTYIGDPDVMWMCSEISWSQSGPHRLSNTSGSRGVPRLGRQQFQVDVPGNLPIQ